MIRNFRSQLYLCARPYARPPLAPSSDHRGRSQAGRRGDARLGRLALADELRNISLACRRADISRSHFYEIQEAFEQYGREGLATPSRRRPGIPHQTPPDLDQRMLEMTEQDPTYSYIRITHQLRLIEMRVSPSAVRCVWARHGLTLRYQRLLFGLLASGQIRLRRIKDFRDIEEQHEAAA